MKNLPKSTEFNKRIPKQSFYENMDISSTIKRAFVEQIKAIYWKNKISPETTNLAAGEKVNEIQIFEIKLSGENLDEAVLAQIDKKIPYYLIFILEYNEKHQVWTAYKEAIVSGNNAFKVGTYYHTDWLNKDEITLDIEGLNIDIVYENFVRQIGGELLKQENDNESLKDSVERNEKRKKLVKQIDQLQQKVRKEKQFNKQVLLNTQLKKLQNELDNL